MSTEVDAVDVIEHNSVRAPTETTNVNTLLFELLIS